jgi:hypothetical protein
MICIAKYKDQLMAVGVIPGAPGSEAKAFADLKVALGKEKDARLMTQVEADVLS